MIDKILFLVIALSVSPQVLGNIKSFLTNFGDFNGLSFLRLGTCDLSLCQPIPHYEEIGCKPNVKNGECCPYRFDIF